MAADYQGGWLGIDGNQRALARSLPTLTEACESPKYLFASPKMLRSAAPSNPILLYRAWYDVLGKYPDYPAQQIGDCVSFGHGHANDLAQCVDIALGVDPKGSFEETDTEFIYGASREVAGILGPFDGSYGSAAVKAMVNVGMVSRAYLGSDGAYSGSRAKSWGRSGPPEAIKSIAGSFRLGGAALVTTWDELIAAVWNGMPVTICSNQGFNSPRDTQGFCAARGSWAHCMMIAGLRFDREGACICQSWGPTQPSGPTGLDQPSFSFWAERKVVERILALRDSWAIIRSPNFKAKQLSRRWLIA